MGEPNFGERTTDFLVGEITDFLVETLSETLSSWLLPGSSVLSFLRVSAWTFFRSSSRACSFVYVLAKIWCRHMIDSWP
jgi:hypothetical protein